MVRIIYNQRSKRIKIFINYYIIIYFYLVIVIEKNFDNLKGFNFFVSKYIKSNIYFYWIK